MMYCNKNLQCHDFIQKDNTMVQIGLHKNEMSKTGFKQGNFKLSSITNRFRTFFKKKCVNSRDLAQILYNIF